MRHECGGHAAEDYLRVRRALGYKLEMQGWLLGEFIAYLEQTAAVTVTIDAAVAWATSPAAADRSYWAQRLSVVRQFARHLQTIDPACEVPPVSLLPFRPRRAIPHLYSRSKVAALMPAAGSLPMPLQAATYPTLIGLLAVSGLRVGEAIRLDRDDLDADYRLLRILHTKFGKSREVVLHESVMRALDDYGRLRDRRFPRPRCEAFFPRPAAPGCSPLDPRDLQPARRDRRARTTPRRRRARPHDLSHAFAVRTLLDWYRDGLDVQARLPLLSTYMGHADGRLTRTGICQAAPELLGARGPTAGAHDRAGAGMSSGLAPTLEAFFTDRLLCQRRVSPNTIASYRDTFRLLLTFANQKTGTPPVRLELPHLDAPLIGAFLEHLETERGTPPARATSDWRRSTRSSSTARSAIPSTPA